MSMVEKRTIGRVKHITRQLMFIKDCIEKKKLIIKHIDTKANLADIFTKFVNKVTMETLRPCILGQQRYPKVETKTNINKQIGEQLEEDEHGVVLDK